MSVGLSSSFIGPIATGSHFALLLHEPTTSEINLVSHFVTTDSPVLAGVHFGIPIQGENTSLIARSFAPPTITDGTTIRLEAQLQDPSSTVLDSGTLDMPWSNTAGLSEILQFVYTRQGGGLTTAQASQLTTIDTNTSTLIGQTQVPVTDATGTTTQMSIGAFLGTKSLSDLTVTEITSGPTGSTVTRNLTAFVFGIIIRIANVPSNLTPITPDDDWYVPDLAVVRIRHGTDLFLRRAIHSSSAIIQWDRGIYQIAFQAVEVAVWPTSMTLEVNWRTGVTGQVFLMLSP